MAAALTGDMPGASTKSGVAMVPTIVNPPFESPRTITAEIAAR